MDFKDNIESKLDKNLKSINNKISIPFYSINTVVLAKPDNSVKSLFQKKRFLLITIFFAIVLTTVGVYAYNKFLYDSKSLPKDSGLKQAEENGSINYSNYSVTVNGITVTVSGVVSDTIRTVLYVDVKGRNLDINDASLIDSSNTQYKLDGISNGYNIQDTKSTSRKVIEFTGGAQNDTTIELKIEKISNIWGPWIFRLPIKVIQAKDFVINKDFTIGNTTIKIKKITCAASALKIDYILNGEFLNICDGYVSNSSLTKSNFLRGGLVSIDNIYEGSTLFTPLTLENNDLLKWIIYTSYNSKKPIEIIIPIR
ncbi:MAG: DUF4179 domain-containing protein [Ruminiclostridium sp.]|nr:DUF4179 domain-containing protein [Ruminiclostridium sp.]